jgi:hypothetical protein
MKMEGSFLTPRHSYRRFVLVYMGLFPIFLARAGVAQDAAGPGLDLPSETLPCKLKTGALKNPLALLKNLGSESHWTETQTTLRELIRNTACTGDTKLALDASSSYSFLIRYGTYSRRVIVHSRDPNFGGTRLFGTTLYDVQIQLTSEKAPSPKDKIHAARYLGNPAPNPLIGSISKAVGMVSSAYGKLTLFSPAMATQTVTVASVKVVKIDIPEYLHRAYITIQDYELDKASSESIQAGSAPWPDKPSFSEKDYLAPLTYAEIGLGIGLIGATGLHQPAKVDSTTKTLVDDTPSTLLTYVAVNWRPWGFDESRREPTAAEAWRIVIGPALTPNPGVVLGVGWSPTFSPVLRSLSIQVGYGVLLANVLRTNDSLGAPPHDSGRQTRRSALGAVFLGVGYGLQ